MYGTVRGGNRPVINLKELNKLVTYALQDGRSVFLERKATARRLYVQDRFKRRIFCGNIVRKLVGICQVPIERPALRISLSMLHNFFSAKSFHQINETSIIFAVETCKDNNISRRYGLDGSILVPLDILIFILQNFEFLVNTQK